VDDVRKDTQKLKVPNWKIQEDGKGWLRRLKLCTKSYRAAFSCPRYKKMERVG
jgi:hypothetical protein